MRDAVEAEPVAPLDAEGQGRARRGVPLLEGRGRAAAGRERRLDAPIVGRDARAALLTGLRARDDGRACHLFTVLGAAGRREDPPGRGVPRGAGGAAVLRGRCLSYGEGITFWPVVEIVRSIAGVPELQAVPDVCAAISVPSSRARREPDAIEARLAGLLGLSTEPARGEDGFLGRPSAPRARRRDGAARPGARRYPLGGAHAARPDRAPGGLVAGGADRPGVPRRPELLDTRPNWGGGKPNASSTLLEPLTAEESERLVANLVGAGLPPEVLQRMRRRPRATPCSSRRWSAC